jgi:riboflavin kinase / FMN adenylyltransferase
LTVEASTPGGGPVTGVVLRGLPEPGSVEGEVALAMGTFDGVHRGHRRLLARAQAEARRFGGRCAVLTFDPHPRCVVDPASCPCMLCSLEDRVRLLQESGADVVFVLPFDTALSRWSAMRFCDALTSAMTLRTLLAGPGFALGHNREGDLEFLRRYGTAHGFSVQVVSPAVRGGRPVSSTRIRAALQAGRSMEARLLLGRAYQLRGSVVRGEGRGRTLGFPTANVTVASERCMPALGVYATWLRVRGASLAAATSIGYRPTFDGTHLTVESFILDFDADIYGEEVALDFLRRLRSERRFTGAAALTAQMRRDVESVQRILAGSSAR